MDLITLEKIKQFAALHTDRSGNPIHNSKHLERVKQNADYIVDILGVKNELDLNLLHAACYLHDVPVNMAEKVFLRSLGRHLFEKELIKKYLPGIFDLFLLSKEERDILYDALVNHAFSIPYRNLNKKGSIYTKILQDADSLDYFSYKRQQDIKEVKKTSLLYSFLSPFSGLIFTIGRKYIRFFLNFPKIASKYRF